ncbi:DUF3016 domain-containing protein [Massilia sp. CF038]|uniref:DUF3016 domain-containing protein n=1 Tax=Massilia sp. CF038 TaxID=1881045 RepID=UPI000921E2D8|nr:DUF3016 domain-containing protein [Massilia sp. CF038]SHH71061.1 Protein of unknown function [Massilia sp. CF038]
MRNLIRPAALAALGWMALASSAALANPATVTYAEPDQFTDVPRSAWDRERILKQLSGHFDALAARLPAGQTLSVEVLDLDLAGRTFPGAMRNPDLRVMGTGADWPHMRLRYAVKEGDKVIKSGEDTLSSMSYLERINRYDKGDSLRYEKAMLDEWFKSKIVVG